MIKRYLAFPKKLINFIHHHIMPKGLWARSLLIIVIPLILLQLIIAIFFYEQHWQTISRRMQLTRMLKLFGRKPLMQ